MDKDLRFATELAKRVNKAGGRAYYVGGFVRDMIICKENKDIDIEIYGIYAKELEEILSKFGEVDLVGESFGVYKVHGFDVDITLPRKEVCTGNGHKDFIITIDPFASFTEAAMRRDLTMNAILKDIMYGDFIDPFGGIEDIKNKVIRHINDNTFVEDPLRVLRVAQFYARFEDFEVAEETKELCKKVDLSQLPKERVSEELSKALLKSNTPSKFFNFLRDINQLDVWFKPVADLIGIQQNPEYHPERDVYTHTMIVIDNVKEKDLTLKVAALCHDFGKVVSTITDENGKISSVGHELSGVSIAEKFVMDLFCNKKLTKEVSELVRMHMRPHVLFYGGSKTKSFMKMFDECDILDKEKLILLSVYDSNKPSDKKKEILESKLDEFKKLSNTPEVTGKDLIEIGLKPGEEFAKFLAFTHKLWLAGFDKDKAIKQLKGQFKL